MPRSTKKVVRQGVQKAKVDSLAVLAKKLEARCDPQQVQPRIVQQWFESLIELEPEEAGELALDAQDDVLATIPDCSGLFSRLCHRLLTVDREDLVRKIWELSQVMRVRLDGSVEVELAKAMIRAGEKSCARALLLGSQREDALSAERLLALFGLEKLEGNVAEAHKILDRIAEADPSLSTMAHVYRERKNLPTPATRQIRIAILSSYVLDPLSHYLDYQCQRVGIQPEFHIAPFNQYVQEIVQERGPLHEFQPEITLLSVWLEDAFPGIGDAPSQVELENAAEDILTKLGQLAGQFQRYSQGLFLITDFVLMHRGPHGILDNRLPHGIHAWVDNLNRRLAEVVLRHERTYLIPLHEVLSRIGIEQVYNPKMYHMARMRLNAKGLGELAQHVVRYVKPLKGLTKKCVVLDLDGTLWGGIVGELGVEGIHLGPSVPGEEYTEFQRALLNLTRRGILLAICSKNNMEDVLPVLRSHPHMVLKEEHFAAMRVNWNNKAENIREIAEELNIGLDSLVFIDDNPNERELVSQVLPEVLTVTPPTDPSRYRAFLEALTDFELLSVTQEDTERVAQYQAIGKRQAIKNAAASIEDYLASLELQVQIEPANTDHITRVAQMCGKTNQFNLTTRRYQSADIERFVSSQEHVVYLLRVRDRFVDHGVVGAAIISKQKTEWRIDELLMSCRVMGLTIEQAFMARLVHDARKGGAETLIGEFIPTKKNVPVRELYRKLGFHLVSEIDEHQLWSLALKKAGEGVPSWITMAGD